MDSREEQSEEVVVVDRDDGDEEEAVESLVLLATLDTYWLGEDDDDDASVEAGEVEPRSSPVMILRLPCFLPRRPRRHRLRVFRLKKPEK